MNKKYSQKNAFSIIEKIPIIAIIITLIGLLLICFPESAMPAVIRVSGAVILIYSVYRLLSAFILEKDFLSTALDLALAFTSLITSIFLLANQSRMSAFISVIFGLYLIADGAFRLWSLAIFKARCEFFGMEIDNKARIIKTVFAAITLAVGVFLVIFPLATHKFIAIITGVCLVFEGIKGIAARIIELRKSPKDTNSKPTDIEADFEDKTDK